eukprot:351277_1
MIKITGMFTASCTGVGMKSLQHWLSSASALIAAREFNLAGDDNKSIGRDGDELNVFNSDGLIVLIFGCMECGEQNDEYYHIIKFIGFTIIIRIIFNIYFTT